MRGVRVVRGIQSRSPFEHRQQRNLEPRFRVPPLAWRRNKRLVDILKDLHLSVRKALEKHSTKRPHGPRCDRDGARWTEGSGAPGVLCAPEAPPYSKENTQEDFTVGEEQQAAHARKHAHAHAHVHVHAHIRAHNVL
jgi:hypothetical protein